MDLKPGCEVVIVGWICYNKPISQFAIGDIHGCLTALQVLDRELGFSDGDTVVTPGDYVDRGCGRKE